MLSVYGQHTCNIQYTTYSFVQVVKLMAACKQYYLKLPVLKQSIGTF